MLVDGSLAGVARMAVARRVHACDPGPETVMVRSRELANSMVNCWFPTSLSLSGTILYDCRELTGQLSQAMQQKWRVQEPRRSIWKHGQQLRAVAAKGMRLLILILKEFPDLMLK